MKDRGFDINHISPNSLTLNIHLFLEGESRYARQKKRKLNVLRLSEFMQKNLLKGLKITELCQQPILCQWQLILIRYGLYIAN